MDRFSETTWAVLGVIAGAGVIGVLHVLASAVQNATEVHDLRLRASELRREYTKRLAGNSREGHADVVVAVVEPEAPGARERRAA